MTPSAKGKKCHISHFKVALVFVPAQIHSPHLMRGHRKGLDTKGGRGCTKLIYLGEARPGAGIPQAPSLPVHLGLYPEGRKCRKAMGGDPGRAATNSRAQVPCKAICGKARVQRQRERDESLIKKNGQEVKEAR